MPCGILQQICTKRLMCQCGFGPSVYIPVHNWVLSLYAMSTYQFMCEQHSHHERTTNLVSFLASTTKFKKPETTKQTNKKTPQWQANQTKHLHFLLDINGSALLNLTKGYLTSFCLTVVAKLPISTATKRTQNALTQGWWVHNWDQKLTQNLLRNKKLFSAEVRISRKGQGRKESTIPTPAKVKTTVRCSLCSLSSHTRVPVGMTSSAQFLPICGRRRGKHCVADARLVSFTPAERIHLSWKWHSISRGEGWGRAGEWRMGEELMNSCRRS